MKSSFILTRLEVEAEDNEELDDYNGKLIGRGRILLFCLLLLLVLLSLSLSLSLADANCCMQIINLTCRTE